MRQPSLPRHGSPPPPNFDKSGFETKDTYQAAIATKYFQKLWFSSVHNACNAK